MRRSERIVRLTRTLLNHPGTPLSLTDMAHEYDAAKSSLSEDLAIIREVMEADGEGTLRTQTGAGGGVLFAVDVTAAHAERFTSEVSARLAQAERILPGGYLYMTDVLGEPNVLRIAGKMFARVFARYAPDVVLTVETKGIPLAVMTAQYLNCPFVVARRDHKWTEGSSVSTNYVSGSDKRVQTMSLSRRSMPEGARVLLVDDFMKAGGTFKGMTALCAEFKATVVGSAVFMETSEPAEKLVTSYRSLFALTAVDESAQRVTIEKGNYFDSERLHTQLEADSHE
ncbi:MAG: pur operon repressor [Firmicutes bacterium]|nr:pur operon repressor [Bacillota bacterium]